MATTCWACAWVIGGSVAGVAVPGFAVPGFAVPGVAVPGAALPDTVVPPGSAEDGRDWFALPVTITTPKPSAAAATAVTPTTRHVSRPPAAMRRRGTRRGRGGQDSSGTCRSLQAASGSRAGSSGHAGPGWKSS